MNNFNYCKSYKDVRNKLDEINKSIFITDSIKKTIKQKIEQNKYRFMFIKMIYRYKIRKAYKKSPWNEKTAVSLTDIIL